MKNQTGVWVQQEEVLFDRLCKHICCPDRITSDINIYAAAQALEVRPFMRFQVSFSGQAVVFVVRTAKHSLTVVAGRLTYIAYFAAQVGHASWVDSRSPQAVWCTSMLSTRQRPAMVVDAMYPACQKYMSTCSCRISQSQADARTLLRCSLPRC